MKISELVKDAYETAKSKGWHDVPATFGDRIALVHSEASEALEAFRRNGSLRPLIHGGPKPEGVPAELADVVIRIADMCGLYGIDLEAAIEEKMAYNKTRSYRHGNKVL